MGRWKLGIVLLGAGLLLSLGRPAAAGSFNCRRAAGPDERTICATPSLSAKDDELARLFSGLRSRLPSRQFASLAAEERQWLVMRNYCRDAVPCLDQWYEQRLWALRSALAAVADAGREARVTTPVAPSPAPQKRQLTGGTGTGYVVTANGDVVTNNHVIEDCLGAIVRMGNQESAAKLVARDTHNDLALLATSLKPAVVPALRAGVRLGENVAVFGYPLHGTLASSGNFTVGNVTATSGLHDDSSALQISASVQPGNSGGPVLDQSGNVVGTVVAKFNNLTYIKERGDIAENVNFAIKESIVENFLEANGVRYSTAIQTPTMQPPDLAERAHAIAVFVNSVCEAN